MTYDEMVSALDAEEICAHSCPNLTRGHSVIRAQKVQQTNRISLIQAHYGQEIMEMERYQKMLLSEH